MIDFNDIPSLYEPFVKAYKKSIEGKSDIDYTPRYNMAVKLFMEIEVHAKGLFPDRLIGENAPSETDEEKEWRRLAFASFTKAPWRRVESAVNSIYHGVSVSSDDEDFKLYLTEEYPVYSGLNEWFHEVASPNKAQDPNGVIFTTIYEPWQNDTQTLKPVAYIANSPEVIAFERNYVLLVIGYDAPIKYYKDTVSEGLKMILIDDVSEYRITQTGKKVDYEFEIVEYHKHKLGYIPAWQLKGVPVIQQGTMIWESVFQNLVPYFDKIAIYSSTLDTCVRRTAYETRVYYGEDCDAEGCDGGYVVVNEERHACDVCQGSGRKGFTPFTDVVRQKPSGMLPDQQLPFPGLAFVGPTNAPMQFLSDYIDNLLTRAGEAVNYDLSRKKGGEITATEANIDLQEWYKTALLFAGQIYDIEDYVIDSFAKIRYPGKEIPYTFNRKVEFSIRTPEQLSAELKQANEAGLPSFVNNKLIDSQLELRFADDPVVRRMAEIGRYMDPLYGKADKDVIMLMDRGVTKEQVLIHNQFAQLIAQAQYDNEGFLGLELPVIKAEIEKRARLVAPTNAFDPTQIIAGAGV